MSSRSRTAGSLVAVLTVLLLALGVLAPAEAATARSISVAASPTATYAGSSVKYSGRVTRSPKGSLVRIQRKAGTSWVTVANTRTTNTTGSFTVRAALPKIAAVYTYRAVAPRASRLATAVSKAIAVTALRRTSVTLAPSPAGAVNPGTAKLLVGKVSPFVPGTTGYVQRLVGTTWSTVTTVIVGTDGSISRSVTPSPTVTTSYRVLVVRAGLNASAVSPTVVVTVNQPPTITTASLPTAGQNLAYSTTLAKSGKAGTWAVTGQLPTGITLSSAGVISGKTAITGTFPITVKFTETATGLSASKALSLTVSAAPVITTTSLPDATRNAAYSQTLTKDGGGNGTWAITTGSLPTGINLNPGTGVISGTPTAHTGSYPFTVTFSETGSSPRKATQALSLKVVGDDVGITTSSLDDATRAQVYSMTLTKTGGAGTWSSTPLPAGLILTAGTGVISGVPSVDTGTYPVTITFTETASGFQATRQYDLSVDGENLTITTTSLGDATRGTAYVGLLTKTGGAGTWSATGLPSGITLNANSGALSGTPVARPKTYGVSVTFTETATSRAVVKSLNLKVTGEDIAVTTTSLPEGTTSTAYNVQLTKTGLDGTWSWTPAGTTTVAPTSTTSLPGGLSLNTTTGVLSGTPSGSGDWNLLFTFTETASGLTSSVTLYLHVSPKNGPVISPASLPNGVVGSAYSADLDASPGGLLGGSWKIGSTAGALPPGLSLNSTTGGISGTPTQAGDFVFIVKYTQGVEQGTNTKRYTIHVDPAG